jgi:hypothetical protein
MSGINPDYSKRDCSLPPGCKDLIDVLRLESGRHPDKKVIELGSSVTVKSLATLLGRWPFQIIADLLALKVMVSVDQSVTFEVAARVATQHGFVAKRAS